jgi:hypothetical protein
MVPSHAVLPEPEHLRGSAFVVGNGERLWPLEAALEIVDWLARQHLGITGGEVYERAEFGWGRYVDDWITEPGLSSGEDWLSYVHRGKTQAAEAILRDARCHTARPGITRLYFLASTTRAEYGIAVLVSWSE